MSELPRTDDLPRTEEGYDPLRVEEAFTSFGERVRELESIAAELRAELRSLRAERAAAFAAPETDPDWPADEGVAGVGAPPDWVAAAVPPPLHHPFTVPRLVLEAVFLLLVALFAGLADLAPEWIALVMAGAWIMVALVEWTAAARRARWRLDEIAPALEPAGDTTGRWSSPVVEATALAAPDVSESRTVVTKLPADPEVAEAVPEDTEETEEPDEVEEAEQAEEAEPASVHDPEPDAAQEPRRGFFRRGRSEIETPTVPADLEAPKAVSEDTAETEGLPEEPEKVERRGLFGRRRPEPEPAETPAPVPTLPADPEVAEDLEGAAAPDEPEPEQRRGLFRRRRAEASAPADPWET